MAKCLRCGAGNEWIEPIGKEPRAAPPAPQPADARIEALVREFRTSLDRDPLWRADLFDTKENLAAKFRALIRAFAAESCADPDGVVGTIQQRVIVEKERVRLATEEIAALRAALESARKERDAAWSLLKDCRCVIREGPLPFRIDSLLAGGQGGEVK